MSPSNKNSNVSPEGAGSFIHIDPYDNPSIIQHVKYTILWKIWPSMLFFTSIAIILLCVRDHTTANPTIPATMLTVLGTVLGFCISYRTSSAYERYIEGRRLWQQIQSSTRTFARLAWFHAPNQMSAEPSDENKESEAAKALLEKKTILNLLEAYAVATKHYLRGETGIHYEDLYPLVAFLPKYQLPNSTPIRRNDMPSLARSADSSAMLTTVDDIKAEDKIEVLNASTTSSGEQVRFRGTNKRQDTGTSFSSTEKPMYGPRNPDKKLLPAHNPPKMDIVDYFPILGLFRSAFKFGRKHVVSFFDEEAAANAKLKKRRHKKEVYSGQNIPVELNMHLSNWISALQRRKTIDGTTAAQFFNANASLADALSGLERVLTTPLPFVYAIHLEHSVYVYLLALPFQVLQTLGWLTIPAVCIASFIFTGFLQIADDIEQPLGYDASDLDLAFFCNVIRKELRELVAQPVLSPEDFFFTPYNEPLAPNDVRSATELLDDEVTVEDIETAFKHKNDNTINRSFTEAHIRKSREDSTEMGYLPTMKREEMV